MVTFFNRIFNKLASLLDVAISNPTNGQGLSYNATESKWVNATLAGSGDLLATNNLSDLSNAATARTNLGLGTAATTAASAYDVAGAATAAQAASLPLTGGTMQADINMAGNAIDNVEAVNFPTTGWSISDPGTGQLNFDVINSSNNQISALSLDYQGNAYVSGNLIANAVTGTSGGNNQLETIRGCVITGSSTIPVGTIASVLIPANATVTNWAVISTDATTGSIAFDILTVSVASFVPNSTSHATSIIGSGTKPNLASAVFAHAAPSSWTTASLTGGTYLIFNVTSAASVMNVRLEVTLTPR